jgi:hypothetical protein
VYDTKMFVRSARVGAGPPDNGYVIVRTFEVRLMGDCDVRGFRRWRKHLREGWAGAEQTANDGGSRQFHEQLIHG